MSKIIEFYGMRLKPGALFAKRSRSAISGRRVELPDGEKLVHLQFRRFAGCPVCDRHLHEFVRRHAEIADAGVREVVVFHSTVRELIDHESHLPFDVIADPNKRLYRELGVESSLRALLDPRAWLVILLGVARSLVNVVRRGAPLPPLLHEGGSLGLPADFLIDRNGRILAAKYGVHAGDAWTVDELLSLSVTPKGVVQADTTSALGAAETRDSELARATARLTRGAYAVLALTTLHHVYGAIRYQTPFRLHIVVVAAIVAGLVVAAHALFARRPSSARLLTLAAATLLFPVVGIGLFEGGYNHALKNALFFADAPERLLLTLFPPPTYELPNDLFFELTGVLQLVPAALTSHAFVSLVARWRSEVP
jgi:peroxiredoxin